MDGVPGAGGFPIQIGGGFYPAHVSRMYPACIPSYQIHLSPDALIYMYLTMYLTMYLGCILYVS
jgi:hypothetical protein